MTTDRKPTPAKLLFLLAFHATLSGAFLVSYLTGDEDTYAMHQFAGYTALAALAVRLAVGMVATAPPLRLPRPSVPATLDWLGRLLTGDARARGQRSPLLAWMAVALLAGVGIAAATGAVADFVTPVEHLHKALGEFSLTIVLAHIALVFALHGLKNAAALGAALRSLIRRVRVIRQEASIP
ncbi:hypothetical protein [Azospirillum sp. sgz302134]